MKDTKLYQVLSNLDKYEQNRCRKYIASPYFNRSEELVILFDYLTSHIHREKHTEISKQEIWNLIQREKVYDDARLRKYLSDLFKLIEDFLAQEAFEADELGKTTYLLSAIRGRKLDILYQATMRKADLAAEKVVQRPAKYYYQKYEIENDTFYLLELDIHRDKKDNLEQINSSLDQFYFAEKMRLFISEKTRESGSRELSLIPEIKKYLQERAIENYSSIVQLYYQTVLLYTEEEKNTHFQKLKQLLYQLSPEVPTDEAHGFYIAAVSYCIDEISSGKVDFYKYLMELYKDMIAKNMIIKDNDLSPWTFKNVVTAAVALKEFDWLENFISTYSQYLPDDFRDNAVSYNLARINFEQKKYDNVISLLREVEYDDISYNLNSKTMLLMTYYETNELDALDYILESFRVFLNRHKEIPKQRQAYFKNLIKFTKKLTKIIPSDEKAIQKIKQEIEGIPSFKVRWLDEKIKELESKK